MKIQCKSCKKETDHVNQGNDIRPDKRYYCSVCRTSNPMPTGNDPKPDPKVGPKRRKGSN